MSRFSRFVALLLGVVMALTLVNGASARVRTVIREPFNGTAPNSRVAGTTSTVTGAV